MNSLMLLLYQRSIFARCNNSTQRCFGMKATFGRLLEITGLYTHLLKETTIITDDVMCTLVKEVRQNFSTQKDQFVDTMYLRDNPIFLYPVKNSQ